jgi:hypothetical protein
LDVDHARAKFTTDLSHKRGRNYIAAAKMLRICAIFSAYRMMMERRSDVARRFADIDASAT